MFDQFPDLQELWQRYGHQVLLLVGALVVLLIVRWVVLVIWRATVRNMAVSELGVTSLERVSIAYRQRQTLPGIVTLRFPRWARANRDGSRNNRVRTNYPVQELSVLQLGHFTFVSKNPTRIYQLVREARAAGNDVALHALEQDKWNWTAAGHQTLVAADSAMAIYQRYQDHPTDFEEFCANVFRAHGWEVVVSPPSRDGGYDLVMSKGSTRLIGECKNFRPGSTVGRPLLQKLIGANATVRADGMVFLTTSGYSPDARTFGQQTGMWLVDGHELARLAREATAGQSPQLPFVRSHYELTREELMACFPPDMRG